jgi:hypothetical protein
VRVQRRDLEEGSTESVETLERYYPEINLFFFADLAAEREDGRHSSYFSLDNFVEEFLSHLGVEKEMDRLGIAVQQRGREKLFETQVDVFRHEWGKSRHDAHKSVENIKQNIQCSEGILLAKRTLPISQDIVKWYLETGTIQTNVNIREIVNEKQQSRNNSI